jgi:hypothetical protein
LSEKPVAPEIHDHGEDERDHDPLSSADKTADKHEKSCEDTQQQRCFNCIHSLFSFNIFRVFL